MALNKEILLDSGVSATYHKIIGYVDGGESSVNEDGVKTCDVILTVASYLDKAARDDGKGTVASKEHRVQIVLNEGETNYNHIAQGYMALLGMELFEGATEI